MDARHKQHEHGVGESGSARGGASIDSYEDDAGASDNVSHRRVEGASEGLESLLDEGEEEDLSGSFTGEREGRGGQIEVEVWREAGRLEALRMIESAELEVGLAHAQDAACRCSASNVEERVLTPACVGSVILIKTPFSTGAEADRGNAARAFIHGQRGGGDGSIPQPHNPSSNMRTPRSLGRESPRSQISTPRSSGLAEHARHLRDGASVPVAMQAC